MISYINVERPCKKKDLELQAAKTDRQMAKGSELMRFSWRRSLAEYLTATGVR